MEGARETGGRGAVEREARDLGAMILVRGGGVEVDA